MGRNLEKLVAFHKSSGGQTDPALTRFLAGVPAKTRDKLVAIGLLSADRVATAKPLVGHLDGWTEALKAQGCSQRHVELVVSRTRKIVDGCGFKYFNDISASKAQAFLNDLRADKEDKRGIGAQTFNFYLQAMKQFCRWMVKDRRAAESPVAHLDGLNVKTDRRHDRRALTVTELLNLLDTASSGPVRFGMSGPERAMLYRLAVQTGLRGGELRSLTRSSFDLDGDNPTVTVSAEYSKPRRQDTLPLRAELAVELRTFLATCHPETLAFPTMPERQHVADMFRADVEAAGLPYRDDADLVADFHSLRHTFITNLARGGVHPKVAQALARHSTITLTMDRYSHTLVEEQSAALDVLPNLSAASQQEARATGTDGAKTASGDLASGLAFSGRLSRTAADCGGLSPVEGNNSPPAKATAENTSKPTSESGEGGIRPARFPQPPFVSAIYAKLLCRQGFDGVWLVPVVTGCYRSWRWPTGTNPGQIGRRLSIGQHRPSFDWRGIAPPGTAPQDCCLQPLFQRHAAAG